MIVFFNLICRLFVVLGKLGLDLVTIWDVTCLLIKENWNFIAW
jgi:hypothetical protein